MPDLTILLKISAKTRIERSEQSALGLNLFNDEESLNKVWQTYEAISKKYPNIIIIDAEKPQDEIFEEIKRAVLDIIK